MTKIEEQRAVILNLLAIGDNAANELLDKFESAIREQVVIDALPSDAGAVALSVISNVKPELTAEEEAFFIAGFIECIKYITNKNNNL